MEAISEFGKHLCLPRKTNTLKINLRKSPIPLAVTIQTSMEDF